MPKSFFSSPEASPEKLEIANKPDRKLFTRSDLIVGLGKKEKRLGDVGQ